MAVSREHRKEWARAALRGLENATMPSFTPDLVALDEEGIRWDVRQAIAHGFFSTMCVCEAGLTLEENKRFIGIVCDEAAGRIQVSLTLLLDSFEDIHALLGHAEQCGASHALLAYPTTFRPADPAAIVEATRRIAERTSLGLVMYATDKFDFVRFHPSHVPFEAYDQIADIPNVVSLKVGFGDPAMTFECFERFGRRVLVNVGTPWLLGLFPLLRRRYGAQWFGGGSWEVWQSPGKPYLVEYYHHVVRGETDQARAIYWRLAAANALAARENISRGGDIGMYHWPLGKYISWSVGGNGGLTRQPAMRLTAGAMQGRKMALRAMGIEPREPDEEFFIGRVRYARERGQAP